MTKTKLLFVQGAGEGSYDEDKVLAGYVQNTQKDQTRYSYPKMNGLETLTWADVEKELAHALGALEDGGTVVAHSLGGAAVLKLLAKTPDIAKIGALHLVATPYKVVDGEWGEDDFALDLDFADKLPKIGSMTFYQSRDDDFVPAEHLGRYGEKLPQASLIDVDGYEHQFASKPCRELLDALEA